MDTVTAGPLQAVYARPDGSGPFPGIVVLHTVAGLTTDIRSITQRFADEGYVAVAPDLYSTGGPRAICTAATLIDMARGSGSTPERIEGVRVWLAAHPDVVGRKIGVIGFCMGGGFAMTAAVHGDYGASSVNYGMVPKSIDHVRGTCPIVGSFAANDRLMRRAPERLDRHLRQLGVEHDVKIYPGVAHGFMNDHSDMKGGRLMNRYDKVAAEDAWSRILDFFAARLR